MYSTILIVIFIISLIAWFFSMKKKKASLATPFLDRYSRDLTQLAKEKKLDVLIGRDKEVKRALQILSRRTKNNVILIGEAGVGKTAIAEGLAEAIANEQASHLLQEKRILALNLGSLLSGTKYRGEFEQRIETVTRELLLNKRSIILFIDEIQTLTQAGESIGAVGAANLLKPFLARGELQVIGAATPEDYFQYIQQDTSLERRFQPIMVKQSTPEQTLEILKGLRKYYEDYHHVKITDAILEDVISLTSKYLVDRYFPDKAIDLIDEAAAKVSLTIKDNPPRADWPAVLTTDLQDVLYQWSSDVTELKRKRDSVKQSV
jgi:ATP-dependent Clp protease ATP-binding subunit ClpC